MATDREKLEKHLDHCSTRVQRNTKVVTPDDVGQDFFLHLSTDTNVRKFIPQLTLRGMPSENRDITRIYVAPTVLGCMLAYGSVEFDFAEKASDGREDNVFYKGGYKIYELPFSAALKPSKSMVDDQAVGDEHWMVTYSPDTTEYVPRSAGRIFIYSVVMAPRNGKLPEGHVTYYVEIVKDEGLLFSKNHFLKKGCYQIEGPLPRNTTSWKDDEGYTVKELSKGEYMKGKTLRAALLSVDDSASLPAHATW